MSWEVVIVPATVAERVAEELTQERLRFTQGIPNVQTTEGHTVIRGCGDEWGQCVVLSPHHTAIVRKVEG